MRTEAVSKQAIISAGRVKPRFDFIQTQEIKKELDKVIPGAPTIGKILVAIREDEIKSESTDLLETNTAVHEVVAIASELNDKRIVPGVFIQVQKNCQMEELEWGSKKYMLIREMSVVWVFDRSPKEEFKKIGEQLFETSSEPSINDNAEITPVQVTSGDA